MLNTPPGTFGPTLIGGVFNHLWLKRIYAAYFVVYISDLVFYFHYGNLQYCVHFASPQFLGAEI